MANHFYTVTQKLQACLDEATRTRAHFDIMGDWEIDDASQFLPQ